MIISKNDKILITGGNGFLGYHVVKKFFEKGYNNIIIFSHKDYDLSKEVEVKRLFCDYVDIDIVIHIAADVGGIGYSSKHPAKQFYNNALINTFVLHYSFVNKIKKFVGIGSVCEYPDNTPVPFKEEQVWNGYPVPTNDAYGLTKRMLLGQSIAYNKEYGFNAIHLLLINMYGPKDDFDLMNSHVIPALIKKFHKAKVNNEKKVEVWGSGKASREFIYVSDAADAIYLATTMYNNVNPINVGTGIETSIKSLAFMISDVVGYRGEIFFNESMPAGQMRRVLDTSKAVKEFDFLAQTDLKNGLKSTYDYYLTEIVKENT